MGCDFLYNTAPACGLDDTRRARLAEIIAALTPNDVPEYFDDYADIEELDVSENASEEAIEAADAAAHLAAWRKRLTDALEALDAGRRDVSLLDLRRVEFPLFLTGGGSWGDSPTDAFDCFRDLGECETLWKQLAAWALEDAKSESPDLRCDNCGRIMAVVCPACGSGKEVT